MLVQPLPMSSALRAANARSLGFLIGYLTQNSRRMLLCMMHNLSIGLSELHYAS